GQQRREEQQERAMLPARGCAAACIRRSQIRMDGQNEEEAAQEVWLSRDPRDDFDALRMDRVPRDGDGGKRGRSLPEWQAAVPQESERQAEECEYRGRVQHDARRVIAARVEIPERILERREHPGERLIRAEVHGGPRPLDLMTSQAPKIEVGEVVVGIVPVDE